MSSPSPIYSSPTVRDTLWHAHGLLMCSVFLVLYPAGILAIRSGGPLSVRHHYLLQLSGSALALTGILVGYVTSTGIVLWHQYVGLFLGLAIVLQGVAGWRHHVNFVRVRRRTWVSHVHLWLGRGAMGLAWANLAVGLRLR
ncbi:MAG: hypothetical protein LQ340_002265, partial [Diploschistes diacapsis]